MAEKEIHKSLAKIRTGKKTGYPTVDDVIDDILKTLSLEFQEKIKEMTVDEFRFSERLKLRMTIKKKYFYRNKAREHLIKILSDKKDYKFLDGDVFSRMVLEKLYEKITKIIEK